MKTSVDGPALIVEQHIERLLDNEGRPVNGSRSYNEDIQEYIHFLNTGLSNYKKTKP